MRNDCWLFLGPKCHGYGYIYDSDEKKHRRAHRVSWEIYHGSIPDKLMVCHRCDTRECVNPKHLFLGTASDNQRDSHKKGRGARNNLPGPMYGEENPFSKLRNEDVEQIRLDYQPIYGALSFLAKKYGVSKSNIFWIVKNKTWRS